MPDPRDCTSRDEHLDPLFVALRSMPLARPQSDGWPALAAQLRTRNVTTRGHRRRRLVWPAAAAAALLAALLIRPVTQEPASDRIDETGQLAAATVDRNRTLIAQSQWLERLVQSEAIEPVALDGDQLLLAQGLGDRIRQIDAALTRSDGEEQARLWQARIGALSQLAEVKWAARQSDWAPGDTGRFRPAASSVTWSN